jgi:hypothetical protein
MLMTKLAKVVPLFLIVPLVLSTTGCPVPKPPKPAVTCSIQIGPNGQRIFKCEVVFKARPISDIQNEVNNYMNVDIADVAHPWEPDPTVTPQSTMTITTDTGYVASNTFNQMYDPNQSSLYAPIDSNTTPRAYMSADPVGMRNWMNAALANGSSTTDLTISTSKTFRLVDSTAFGTYTDCVQNDNSGGIDFYSSTNYTYCPLTSAAARDCRARGGFWDSPTCSCDLYP